MGEEGIGDMAQLLNKYNGFGPQYRIKLAMPPRSRKLQMEDQSASEAAQSGRYQALQELRANRMSG